MVITVLAVAVVYAIAWLGVVSPEREKASKLNAQISTAKTQLATAESDLQNARGAQSSYAAAYASIVNLGKAVPPSQEVPSLIYQITRAADEKNVGFTQISTGTSGSGSSASASGTAGAALSTFTSLPFTFTFEGGFFALEHLFRGLADFTTLTSPGHIDVSGRLLTVQSVKLAPAAGDGLSNSGALTGTVTATAYTLPASQGLTGSAASPSSSATGATPASSGSASSPTTPAIVKATP
jgi:Type II secretion system (T2SS), protein M